jgi:hypothetical protein
MPSKIYDHFADGIDLDFETITVSSQIQKNLNHQLLLLLLFISIHNM